MNAWNEILLLFLLGLLVWVAYKIASHFNESSENDTFQSFTAPSKPLQTPTYAELLQRTEWRSFRARAFKRYGTRCQCCSYFNRSTRGLNVHHNYYLKDENDNLVNPWDYPLSAVSILCTKCHHEWHRHNTAKVFYKNPR